MFFGGQLPSIPIRISTARSYLGAVQFKKKRDLLGKVRYSDFVLCVSRRFDLPQAEVEDTILHEMIHLYIYVNGIEDTSAHGVVFRKMLADLNERSGRHITISHRSSEVTMATDVRVKPHLICVTTLASGERCVTVCARTRIFHIYHALRQSQMVKDMQWFYTTNPFFNRYPNSLSAKLYKISAQELEENLVKAVPLECDGKRMTRKS